MIHWAFLLQPFFFYLHTLSFCHYICQNNQVLPMICTFPNQRSVSVNENKCILLKHLYSKMRAVVCFNYISESGHCCKFLFDVDSLTCITWKCEASLYWPHNRHKQPDIKCVFQCGSPTAFDMSQLERTQPMGDGDCIEGIADKTESTFTMVKSAWDYTKQPCSLHHAPLHCTFLSSLVTPTLE